MCFFNDDCDWYATIQENTLETSTKNVKCSECRRTILAGELYRHIYMQEREEGVWVDEGYDEDDIGETFEYDRCRECEQILLSIRVAEIEEGCKHQESQPHLQQLGDALCDEPDRYLGELKMLFPSFSREHLRRLCSERIVLKHWDQVEHNE